MVQLMKVRTHWAGTSGGPGLTQHMISRQDDTAPTPSDALAACNAVRHLWTSLIAQLPNELTLTVDPQVDLIDETSGQLINTLVATPTPAGVTGTASAGYAAGCGIKITWETGQVANGRRKRAFTYVVPAAGGLYDTDGTLTSSALGSFNTAADNMLNDLNTASLKLNAYHRPAKGASTGGIAYAVSSRTVKDKTAILRSRRD